MDALTFLRAEHQIVFDILEWLESRYRGGRARTPDLAAAVRDLVIAETRRARLEKELFWPAVRHALDDGAALADRALAQEEAGLTLRRRLQERSPGEPAFDEALSQLVSVMRERMMDAERLVWPRMAAALTQDELQELGGKLELARGSPPSPSTA
jgi:hypothetical protein